MCGNEEISFQVDSRTNIISGYARIELREMFPILHLSQCVLNEVNILNLSQHILSELNMLNVVEQPVLTPAMNINSSRESRIALVPP